jgi:DNA-binding CsgD family transcriptional regulator
VKTRGTGPAPEEPFSGDLIREIVAPIVDLVPTTDWAFAAFGPNRGVERFQASSAGIDERWLSHQAVLRSRPHPGYRITPLLRGLGRYASGLTLTFADQRTEFAALTLLRGAELGPFASSEIKLLVFALDWASERLSTLRLMEAQYPHDDWAPAELDRLKDARDASSALYVLDHDYAIVLGWSAVPDEAAAIAAADTHLPRRIEQSVRDLTRTWTDDPATRTTGVARPASFLVVLTQPLAGAGGFFIGVVVQLFKESHSLTAGAGRFAMSPREAQVLALLLDGARIPQIGARLFVTPSTVQDHIKSLLHKTSSQNRSQMIAKILGWGRE